MQKRTYNCKNTYVMKTKIINNVELGVKVIRRSQKGRKQILCDKSLGSFLWTIGHVSLL